MVGRILASNLLYRQALQWHPSQASGPPTSCSFTSTGCSEGSECHLAHPTQPIRAEEERIPRAQNPQLTWDYREVRKEETVMLVIIFPQCTIWARVPPNTLCRTVQELHRYLALVMENDNWSNMEKDIWEGVMKGPMVAAAPMAPMPKRVPFQASKSKDTPGIYLTRTFICIWVSRGDTPSRPGSSTKEAATTSPGVFSPGLRRLCHITLNRYLPAGGPNPVWSPDWVTGDDHLPHPSDGKNPLLPPSSEPGYDNPPKHIQPRVLGTLCEGQRSLSDYNALPYLKDTYPKYEFEQILAPPLKWTVDRANTHSPDEVAQ